MSSPTIPKEQPVFASAGACLARKRQWDALLDALETLLDAPTPTGTNAALGELLGRTWEAAVEQANRCELEAEEWQP